MAAFVGVVVLIAVVAAANAGDNNTTATDTGDAHGGVFDAVTTAAPDTAAPGTAPSTTRHDEFDEVSVVPYSVTRDDYFVNWFYVVVQATNTSSKSSNYAITVACFADGIQVDDTFTYLSHVDPGVTAQERVLCETASGDVQVDAARVTAVERNAAADTRDSN